MAYLIGIDVGTTGTKTLLIDEGGNLVASALYEYPMYTPRPLWAEQDPEDWWQATVSGLREVLEKSGVKPQEIAGLGLTGQMHGMVLLDAEGNVLRRCIMWNDQRTAKQCQWIMDTVGRERFLELAMNPALPGFTAPKIIWTRENEPEVYSRVEKVLLPKDYIRYRLTGVYATEVSDASGTVLLDVRRRRWSEEILEKLDIPREWMPRCLESPEISGYVTAEASKLTGLPEGLPVAGGGGDQAAGAVGTGIVEPGLASVILGTSGVVFVHTDAPRIDPEGAIHCFCHAVPGKYHLMGVVLSAGGSFQWYRDVLASEEREVAGRLGLDPYELLTKEAERVPPGAEGLLFLPYLSGERTPHMDPAARGAWIGLSLAHRREHLVRAVLEGVAFALKDSLVRIQGLGASPEELRSVGGGMRSPLWRRIIASVLGVPLRRLAVEEGAAYGAALLAGVGAGVYTDVYGAVRKAVRLRDEVERPDPELSAIYRPLYERFTHLYPALKEVGFG